MLIRVYHLLVDQILNVNLEEVHHHVVVFQIILVHRQIVVRNVQLILNVIVIWPVFAKNVGIHVQDHVELMQIVMSSIIHQHVHVSTITLETLSQIVIQNHLVRQITLRFLLYFHIKLETF